MRTRLRIERPRIGSHSPGLEPEGGALGDGPEGGWVGREAGLGPYRVLSRFSRRCCGLCLYSSFRYGGRSSYRIWSSISGGYVSLFPCMCWELVSHTTLVVFLVFIFIYKMCARVCVRMSLYIVYIFSFRCNFFFTPLFLGQGRRAKKAAKNSDK